MYKNFGTFVALNSVGKKERKKKRKKRKNYVIICYFGFLLSFSSIYGVEGKGGLGGGSGKRGKGAHRISPVWTRKNQISFLYINANTFFSSPLPSPSESMFLLFLIFPPKVAYINAKGGRVFFPRNRM